MNKPLITREELIEEFNKAMPSKEFFEDCKKASKLFKEGDTNEQDMADIRSTSMS